MPLVVAQHSQVDSHKNIKKIRASGKSSEDLQFNIQKTRAQPKRWPPTKGESDLLIQNYAPLLP